MFGSKKRIEKRRIAYEKLSTDLEGKIERCENKELKDKLEQVLGAVNAMYPSIDCTQSRKDAKIWARFSSILSITDNLYQDVKERFNKDCDEVISLIGGGKAVGYKLNFWERRAREKRLAGEGRKAQLEEAIKNVESYANEVLELDAQINECNRQILKEKDDNKAVLILREKKNIERKMRQTLTLKEQNERVITLAANEEYVAQQKLINERFDIKRMSATARQMQKLAAEQKINDRLYAEITALTDSSMNSGLAATQSELAQLRKIKETVKAEEKEKVFERSDVAIAEIEDEYSETIAEDEIKA